MKNPALKPYRRRERRRNSRSPMAELAFPIAGDDGDRASFNTVYIDTTLGTTLAMDVDSSDTVADLKRKIIEEHLVCFPECGAISIRRLKVKKRGGVYYNLAESMLVKSAFDGSKKSWYISVEASEIEATRDYEEEGNWALVEVNKNGLEDERVGLVIDVPRGVVGDGGLLVTIRNKPRVNQNGCVLQGGDLNDRSNVKEKRKKWKRSKKGDGEVSGKDGNVLVNELGTKGGEERTGDLVLDVPRYVVQDGDLLNEPSNSIDHGDKFMPVGVVVGSESCREEKSDEQAQDVEVHGTKTKIDGSISLVGELNHQFDGHAQEFEVQVVENRMDGSVLQGGDLDDNSNVKEKRKKRKRIENASAEGPEVHGEPAKDESKKDDLVSERSDKPSMETSEHEPVTKKLKTGKEMENEGRTLAPESTEMTFDPSTVSQLPADADGKMRRKMKKKSSKKLEKEINAVDEILQNQGRTGNENVVSELNDMTSEQLPTGDDQQPVNDTVEGSDADAKKKNRKKKSFNKMDKKFDASDEQSLKEAGGDNGNVVSGSDDMNCDPPTVSQLPIGDEQQPVNATVGASYADAKNSSMNFDKEINVGGELSLKEATEPNDMNCDPPTVSQLPIGDDQLLVNATVEGSKAEVKKKRKKKSSKRIEKEVNAVDEQSLKEGGGDNGNVVSEPNDMTGEPPTVSQLPIGDEQLVNATAGASNADGEVSLKEARSDNVNVISDPNDMNCDPPTVSQLPIRDDQQLVNATVEGSEAEAKKKRKKKSSKKIDKEVNAVDEQSMKEAGGDNGNVVSEPNDKQQVANAATVEASDPDTKKKKRKKKSSNKMDKEVNADVGQSLKEAGDDNGNVVEELRNAPTSVQQKANEHMLQPSVVSLNDKDTGPVQESQHDNFPSQDDNDLQKPVPDEMHIVATEVQKEVHSELPEAVPSLGLFALKKQKKSRKHKDLSSCAPVTSDIRFFKDAVIDNSIQKAAEKGSDGKEAVVAESQKASLLVTEDEINEVIKNVVDSVPHATESKAVPEVKERKSKKKAKKKHDSDATPTQAEYENTGENMDTNLVNTRTGNLLSKVDNDAEKISNSGGVDFMAYFSPTEQDKKTSDHSEVTGACITTKGQKKRKVQDTVPPKLPETGKPAFEASPHVGSSGKENKRKEVHKPNVSKAKEAVEHVSESFTSSTSKPKRSNNVKGGRRGSNANTGEVLNGTALPKPLPESSSVFKRNLFGDSDDSLETYVFPTQRGRSRSSTPDPDSDVSSDSDGESDAGFDGETRNVSGGPKGMKTPFPSGISLSTLLKSSSRFKKAKLDAESQPNDFVPMSPSISI
ncbi:hypothetical protein LINGRAHAP2_LOCUS36992 [Linum grandiflorum]